MKRLVENPVKFLGAIIAALLAIPAAEKAWGRNSSGDAAGKQPFEVKDSIAWRTYLDFDGNGIAAVERGPVLSSPSGKRFVVQVRSGDVASNSVVDELLLFSSDQVNAVLSKESGENLGRSVAPEKSLRSVLPNRSSEMTRIRWLDDANIAFIARDQAGIKQLSIWDIRQAHADQITHSPTPVTSYAVGPRSILYYASVPTKPVPDVVRITDQTLWSLILPPAPDSSVVELFEAQRHGRGDTKVIVGPSWLESQLNSDEMWVSPSGRYAITFMPAVSAPSHWAEYQIPNYRNFGYAPDRVSADPTSVDLMLRTRYALVDLKARTVKPLLDGPSGLTSGNLCPTAVFWMDNEQSVIVSHTYLPLEGNAEQRKARAMRPAIAEVDIQTGTVKTILWEPGLTDAERAEGKRQDGRILALSYDSGRQELKVKHRKRTREVTMATYQRRAGQWSLASELPAAATQRDSTVPFSVQVRQDLNTPPRYFASGGACECERMFYDPNPQAASLRFGKTQIVTWSEPKYGITWRGGLLLPTDYVEGKKYPLVVQTHGFDPDAFLLDGPMTPGAGAGSTAMAAQVLANAGFVVLQVEDNRAAFTSNLEEGLRFAEGFHAGIQELIGKGLVDSNRVGIVAFSRTGIHVIQLLRLYPDLIAAASIADASHTGYFTHPFLLNASPDIVAQEIGRSGPAPDLAKISEFFSQDSLYSLTKTQAAMRLEAIGTARILDYWEMFWLLRSNDRAVDFVSFPRGDHVLQLPAERAASQGGTIDWFRFWLQDEEDADPAKSQQYQAWRAMRTRKQ